MKGSIPRLILLNSSIPNKNLGENPCFFLIISERALKQFTKESKEDLSSK